MENTLMGLLGSFSMFYFVESVSAFSEDRRVSPKVYVPTEIDDLSFQTRRQTTMEMMNRELIYSISYQTREGQLSERVYTPHNLERMETLLVEVPRLMTRYARSRGLNTDDCRPDYNLHIFIVEKSVLYTPARFTKYFANSGRPLNTIWGYYSSTLEIERNSIIILADIPGEDNDALFAHEFAHYFWDRVCIGTQLNGGTEAFAQGFQAYYLARS